MDLKLNDIGDGLFLELTEEENLFITDFGSQQAIDPQRLNYFRLIQQANKKIDFALTHFHKDHYSGLFNLEENGSSIKFSHVYIPRLPNEPVIHQFLQALFTFNAFSLGGMSGSLVYDFKNLIRRINIKKFKICPISQGDTFFISDKNL